MSEAAQQILETIQSQDFLEYIGLIFGILYVIFAAKNQVICWIFGIISCAAIAYKDFTDYQLYQDGYLQLFYIGMGIMGLYSWKYGRKSNSERPIDSWPISRHGKFALLFGVIALATGLLFDQYTDASFPYLDAITTSFSIYATILLVKRIKENWILWIIVDLVYIYLYSAREAYFFAFLMVIYTLIAVYGLVNWGQKHSNQNEVI